MSIINVSIDKSFVSIINVSIDESRTSHAMPCPQPFFAASHKNGFELKNPQEIYSTIFSSILACTKNGYVVAPSSLPCLNEWRAINVLEQVGIQPCIKLIWSFSVDQAEAVCKIFFIHEENFIWHPLFFHKTSLSIAGQRIVRLQDSQRGICTKQILFQGFMNARNSYIIYLQQERFILSTTD